MELRVGDAWYYWYCSYCSFYCFESYSIIHVQHWSNPHIGIGTHIKWFLPTFLFFTFFFHIRRLALKTKKHQQQQFVFLTLNRNLSMDFYVFFPHVIFVTFVVIASEREMWTCHFYPFFLFYSSCSICIVFMKHRCGWMDNRTKKKINNNKQKITAILIFDTFLLLRIKQNINIRFKRG